MKVELIGGIIAAAIAVAMMATLEQNKTAYLSCWELHTRTVCELKLYGR